LAGVDVRRLAFTSFGKKNLLTRIIGTASFLIQCFFIGLFTRPLGGIFFSTSPPMIGFTACWLGLLRRVPVAYWAMDLNPDQLIVMGKIKAHSLRARVLEAVNRFILRRSAVIFALDRFMVERLSGRGGGNFAAKIKIDPPWPHDSVIEPLEHRDNPFRIHHQLEGKFVIMYSGNHSPANPLKTILDAAIQLRQDASLCFVFVGGGLGKCEVESCIQQHQLTNVLSLPYQPLADLKYSLSAADIHLVSLGENMVGIIHPCKIYGAMAVGRPILFLGPQPSHISDILQQQQIGWHIAHGNVDAAVATITTIRNTPQAELARMGRKAQRLLKETLSQEILCGRFCDHLESSCCAKGTNKRPSDKKVAF
ncbi:MAG: glycosyltransferase family 4 protein, partial [Planctomycetia bacterium]|nr:glycosyltransferase family 4 protein [Planctomycetia bacterium]